MRILDRVDISGSMNLASTAKDTFTIGSQLENSDVNADNLIVYANADFKNNVILGSSSADTITANAAISASAGVSASYFIGDGSGLYNLPNGGGNGGSNINVQTSGSGQNIVADYNNGTLTFRSLVAGDNIYFNGNGGEIQINASAGGGGGQQNNSLNVQATGSGISVFASHESGTLTLRSIKAGSGVSIQEQNGDILVATSGSSDSGNDGIIMLPAGTLVSSIDIAAVLLLHGDGENHSRNITDSCFPAQTINASGFGYNGIAEISTDQSKFGGSSIYLNGWSWLDLISTNGRYVFGTNDFTIESWVYLTSYGQYGDNNIKSVLFDTRGSGGDPYGMLCCFSSDGKIGVYSPGYAFASNSSIGLNQWHHIAFVRQDGVLKLFIDGALDGSSSFTRNLTTDTAVIGASVERTIGTAMFGYIDDFRVSKSARYTASFSPPTGPLTDNIIYLNGSSGGGSSNTAVFSESGSNKYRLATSNGNFELYSYERNKKQWESIGPPNAGPALVVYGNGDYEGVRLYNRTSTAHWNVYTENITNNLLFNYNLSGYSAWLTTNTNAQELDFTGQHRCKQANTNESFEDKIGLIVVATGEYANIAEEKGITINEALPKISLSAVRNQKNVFGVISNKEDGSNTRTYKIGAFVSSYPKQADDQRIIVNSLGEGGIWVCNINGDLENGDYITTCEIPGFGMKQDDGFLRNYTVAKITTDCNFDLNSSVYDCVEFQHNGTTYRKAFVGCTYHCG